MSHSEHRNDLEGFGYIERLLDTILGEASDPTRPQPRNPCLSLSILPLSREVFGRKTPHPLRVATSQHTIKTIVLVINLSILST
jgi:hypothetical protein